MTVFFSLSKKVLPYNRVCNKEDFVNYSNLKSILLHLIKRVYLSSLNIGQWGRKCEKDSVFTPRLQTGFKQS